MKTYRITDALRLVRYGNRLRAEVDDVEIDDLDATDVARIVDLLVDVVHAEDAEGDFAMADSGSMTLTVTASGAGGPVTVDISDDDDEDAPGDPLAAVTLAERYEVRLLLEILTGTLAKLCEEGV